MLLFSTFSLFVVGAYGFPNPQIPGGDVSALPPQYLSIDRFDDCLESFQASSTHREICLPNIITKSVDCPTLSYNELQNLRGVDSIRPCPIQTTYSPPLNPPRVGSTRPAYLDVFGWEDCLESFQSSKTSRELCLPPSEVLCDSSSTWNELHNTFEGSYCPVLQDEERPPKYLSVNRFEDCLESFQASSTHREICLPNTITVSSDCPQQSYNELRSLKGVDSIMRCPIQTVVSPPLNPPKVGSPRPAYLDVFGWENCLESYQNSETSRELCLPPSNESSRDCDAPTWIELENTFAGSYCPIHESSIGSGAPPGASN